MNRPSSSFRKGRRSHRSRALGVLLAGSLALVLVQCGLGPREETDPARLAGLFTEQFGFAPGADVVDLRHRIAESPDDFLEWFRFQADEATVERLLNSFTAGPEIAGFPRSYPNDPDWWSPSDPPSAERHFGYRIGGAGHRFSSQEVFLSHDRSTGTVHFHAASLR